MATTSPARIDDDLFASAKLAGEVQSRSAAQQVAHWARIGREIEASASISPRDVAAVLNGSRPYDGLSAKEQAVVRAEWAERMDARRLALDLSAEFTAKGRSWVELDKEGTVVERGGPARADQADRGSTPARRTTGNVGAARSRRTSSASDPRSTTKAAPGTKSTGKPGGH